MPFISNVKMQNEDFTGLDYSFYSSCTPSLQQFVAHLMHRRSSKSEVLFADLLVIVEITLPVIKKKVSNDSEMFLEKKKLLVL